MTDAIEVWPGRPYPLGAAYDGGGTNFSLFSEVAEKVELCLFDEEGNEQRVALEEVDASCWHGYLPVGGARAALRLPGARALGAGARASAATRPSCCSTRTPRPSRARSTGTRRASRTTSATRARRNDDDSAPHVPKSVVHNPYFDWGNDRPPDIPLNESIIYEVHVKGFTAAAPRHPRGAARHLRRPGATRRRSSTSPGSASPRWS